MATLHERITAAVEKRLAVAQAATPGPWHVMGKLVTYGRGDDDASGVIANTLGTVTEPTTDAEHIAANDPARIIRDCRRDLKVLERHKVYEISRDWHEWRPELAGPRCPWDNAAHPCVEIRDLAAAYEIGVEEPS